MQFHVRHFSVPPYDQDLDRSASRHLTVVGRINSRLMRLKFTRRGTRCAEQSVMAAWLQQHPISNTASLAAFLINRFVSVPACRFTYHSRPIRLVLFFICNRRSL